MTAEGAAHKGALEEARNAGAEIGRNTKERLGEARSKPAEISRHARERLEEGRDRIEERFESIPDMLPERAVMQRRVRIATFIILLVCAGLVVAGFATGTLRSLESLQSFVLSLGWFGPVVYIILVAAQCVFPIIPGGIGIVAGPVLFGSWLGFTFNWIGISLGSFAAFFIARHFGMSIIERIFPAALVDKFDDWTDNPRFTRLFALAILLPVAPDDLLCYLAGTTKLRFRTYALIIVTCKPPSLAVYSFGLIAALEGIGTWLG
nr:TVP38/TMEM64 family protein [Actinomycetales bacterium]